LGGDGTWEEEDLGRAVDRACRGVGFFYVAGHGVEEALLGSVLSMSGQLFALPEETKRGRLGQTADNRGWTPLGEERLDPGRQPEGAGDTKEGFYIGREVSEGTEERRRPYHGGNVWPGERCVPGFRSTMEHYFAEMSRVAMRLVRVLCVAMKLPPGFFDRPGRFDRPCAVLRLLRYAETRSDPGRGVFAAGAHTDYGMLTLLHTDGKPGLQICVDRSRRDDEDAWVDVPHRPGCLVVNLGDMLERWSNGAYRSTLHRVIIGRTREEGDEKEGGDDGGGGGKHVPDGPRLSVPFFFDPNFDCLVECLPGFGEPRFPPITSGEHLAQRYAATHDGLKAPPGARKRL